MCWGQIWVSSLISHSPPQSISNHSMYLLNLSKNGSIALKFPPFHAITQLQAIILSCLDHWSPWLLTESYLTILQNNLSLSWYKRSKPWDPRCVSAASLTGSSSSSTHHSSIPHCMFQPFFVSHISFFFFQAFEPVTVSAWCFFLLDPPNLLFPRSHLRHHFFLEASSGPQRVGAGTSLECSHGSRLTSVLTFITWWTCLFMCLSSLLDQKFPKDQSNDCFTGSPQHPAGGLV